MSRTRRKFFYGWVIVAVVALAEFMVLGSHTNGLGYFFKPMSEELGWSRSLVAGVVSTRTLLAAALAIPFGFLLDRHGPRVLIAAGAFSAGLATIALGAVQSVWQFYLLYGVLGAVGTSAVNLNVSSASVAKWFVRRRGRAMAFTVTGLPLSGVILPTVILLLITSFGWRLSWVGLGLMVLVVVVPAALFLLKRQPEDLGLLPDGDEGHPPHIGSSPLPAGSLEESWTVREAVRTPALWLLVTGMSLGGIAQSALFVHQIPYMNDKGFTIAEATIIVTLISGGAFVNKFFWGLLAERFPLRYLMATSFAVSSAGLLVFIAARSFPMLLVYATITGITRAMGLWTSLAYADYFGRRFLGALRGVISPIQAATSAFSPLFAGVVYDATGSYDLAFQALAACVIFGALIVALAKPPSRTPVSMVPAEAKMERAPSEGPLRP